MYDRLTDDSRMTMVLALREAEGRHQNYVGSEHLLLGLIGQRCAGAEILRSLGVSPEELRTAVDRSTPSHPDAGETGTPPTPLAKGALEDAIQSARELGHDVAATGHLLLGLVRDPEGLAGRILRGQGVCADRVRKKLIEHNSDR